MGVSRAEAFVQACQHGDLETAKWAADNMAVSTAVVGRAFSGACVYGNLEVARYLWSRFGRMQLRHTPPVICDRATGHWLWTLGCGYSRAYDPLFVYRALRVRILGRAHLHRALMRVLFVRVPAPAQMQLM